MGHRDNQEAAVAEAEELVREYQTMKGDDDNEGSRSVDPRLVALLQYFRKLYVERREIFKKIFPEEFGDDMLKKIRAVMPRDHHHHITIDENNMKKEMFGKRSLSMDSPRTPTGKGEAEQPMKLERFKVKTFDVKGGLVGGGQGTQQQQGGATSR